MKGQLLLLIKRGLILLAVVFVLDFAIGSWLKQMFFKQKHGDDAVTSYVIEHANDSILIFGSSRASHHYVPDVLSAATGETVYNAGRDEMTITYTDAILPLVYKRYSPSVVIIEIAPFELNIGNYEPIIRQRISTVLLPFAAKYAELIPTVCLASETERYKMMVSRIYPYNSLAGTIIQNTYTHIGHVSIKGYEPLSGAIDSINYTKPIWGDFTKDKPLEPALVKTLKHIITLTREHNTKLILTISPFYFAHDFSNNSSYHKIQKIAANNNIPFYDFSHEIPYLMNPHLFKDDVHLNDSGAQIYSRMFAEKINALR
ncbi:MAG: hypothetical protein JST82_13410 [Bacteroidetes bacterium]|nr:hypothetical protein [Bacteroidota bacterium]